MFRFITRTAACCAVLCASLAVAQDRENFDIRLSTEKSDALALAGLRGADAAARFESTRQGLQVAEDALRSAKPHLRIIPSAETGVAEVIGVSRGAVELTPRSAAAPEQIAREFLVRHSGLYGLSAAQAGALTLDANYLNPAGNMRWVRFSQRVNDTPLFRGYVTVAMNRHGQVVRATGQLAGGIVEHEADAQPVLDADAALQRAASSLGVVPASAPSRVATENSGRSVTFAWPGDSLPIKTELMYFPLGAGKLELAWSTMVPDSDGTYMIVLSALDGTVLFRKNLTDEAAYNYTVYPTDNPAPLSPGPVDPNLGTQGARILPSVISIESLILSAPSAQNPWLPNGAVATQGNNAVAGLDIDGINGVDAPVGTTGALTFNHVSNPPPGSPAPPGEAPTTVASRNAAVVNLFYWTNRFHDETYELGFTEDAFNFQTDNYGRGGAGGDPVSAEAQDSAGTNNANFNTPPDGGAGRMQMFLWTGPAVDRDGSFDAEIIIHEYTHGLSNRLHGNATGLSTNMARGMGEGWGDFYAHSMLSDPADPIDGVYALGGYSTLEVTAGFTGNYYYGIRRFPKAIMSATGGPFNFPFNPLTFSDLNVGSNLADGAFPRGPIGVEQRDQVHNAGEVWSSALWEARAKVIDIHGAAAGNQRMLQLVTDGMKLNPAAPTFLQARDSIIAATCAGFAGEDEVALWEGFALRGMGYSASIVSAGSPAVVVEAFDFPIGGQLDGITETNLSCATPGRNPGPGDTLELAVTVTNTFCATTLQNVVVSIAGGDSVVVGDIPAGGSATPILLYTIPAEQACGTTIDVPLEFSSDLGVGNGSYTVQVGDAATDTISFSTAVPTAIPAAGTSGVASPYPSTVAVAGVTAPVVGLTLTFNNFESEWFADSDLLLVSPTGAMMVVFSDAFNTDSDGTPPMTFTLTDSAAAVAPASGLPSNGASYRPTDHTAGDTFSAPAPAGPYQSPAPVGAATFASFAAGMNVNGLWSLYAVDDASSDISTLAGWTLGVIVSQPVACADCVLSVGGTVTGLAPGASVTLQNNGADDLVINADGAFTFPTLVLRGLTYEVTVSSQPGTPPQFCSVTDGSGTLTGANVENVVVTCANVYSVGGNVSGLVGSGLELQLNGGAPLPIAADGAFVFPQALFDNEPYEISVASQPSAPDQLCTVIGGSGTITGADFLGATVTCVSAYSIGGTVAGLAPGASVELQLNGGTTTAVNADGAFVFGSLLPDGPFSVTVLTQPTEQTCVVQGGEGTVAGADVTDVQVVCTTDTYSVGGTAAGIAAGESVSLVINGGETLVVNADGAFTFSTELESGIPYNVVIDSQTSDAHLCTLANGDGTVTGADVTDLLLLCRTFPIFGDGFED